MKNKQFLKLLVVLIIIVTVFWSLKSKGVVDTLSDVKKLQIWFRSLGIIGYLAFIIVYILMAVFMFPASALTIVGGMVFGSILGGVLSIIGATMGATVAFAISKYFARNLIISKFGSSPIVKKIDEGVKKNGISLLILTRLVPIFPYNLQNYAYGLTSMKILIFSGVSFLTMIPGVFIYAYLAGEILVNGISIKLLIKFTLAGLILFVLSMIPKYIDKEKKFSGTKHDIW